MTIIRTTAKQRLAYYLKTKADELRFDARTRFLLFSLFGLFVFNYRTEHAAAIPFGTSMTKIYDAWAAVSTTLGMSGWNTPVRAILTFAPWMLLSVCAIAIIWQVWEAVQKLQKEQMEAAGMHAVIAIAILIVIFGTDKIVETLLT